MIGKRITGQELIRRLVELPEKIEIVDCSINGKCSKCGECCSPYLPMCQEELEIIQEYVFKNNIKPQEHMLVMENKLTCPYYDGKKCLIYEVRPLICREFYCYKKPGAEMAKKFVIDQKKYVPVDFWAIAKCLEKQRRDYARIKGTMQDGDQ